MYEQDYIMRLVREMVRMLLKILFHIDTTVPTAELLGEAQEREALNQLLELVDDGNINEAENRLFELISDESMTALETALLFYSCLNDRTDEFLEEHDFSREEIQAGLKQIIHEYRLEGLTDIFQ